MFTEVQFEFDNYEWEQRVEAELRQEEEETERVASLLFLSRTNEYTWSICALPRHIGPKHTRPNQTESAFIKLQGWRPLILALLRQSLP